MLAALLLVLCSPAFAEEADDLTASCTIKVSAAAKGSEKTIADGSYETYWESKKGKNASVTIDSPKPVYGLYLCFERMPESYSIQASSGGDQWTDIAEGDTRFHHVFYPLNGEKRIRIYADKGNKKQTYMGFNEIFVFGEGDVPDWVQQWKEPAEKQDILFLATHPDDELLFMGGAIATYAVEKEKQVMVAYLSYSNTTRRSEALNGLWTIGVRQYPVFLNVRDVWSDTLDEAYKKVDGGKKALLTMITELFRKYKPDVVVTHDLKGEYGHQQHIMVAKAAVECWEFAANPEKYPDSAGKYGTWEVKKLYLHLYGDIIDSTKFDWNVPLEKAGGKTANELAAEAYSKHVTQKGKGQKIRGVWYEFSVEEFGGKLYPSDHFGLYATRVGQDVIHDDFLENLPSTDENAGTGSGNEKPAETVSAEASGEGEGTEAQEAATDDEVIIEESVEEEPDDESPAEGEEEPDDESTAEAAEETDTESGEESGEPEQSEAETDGENKAAGQRGETAGPEWADVALNSRGFLDNGEYVLADQTNGHYMYVNSTIRIQIEETVVTPDKKHPFHCFTAHIWCDVDAGELPHTVSSNPDNPRKDPKTIATIGEEQKIVFATSTDYYTYRVGRKKSDKSVHVGIEIRNGEVYYDDPQIKEKKMPNYETLAFLQDGSGSSWPSKERSADQYLKDGATQVFTFGPCLVRDGELTEYLKTANTSYNPRLAMGVAEPGHYVVMLCEGRLARSKGVKMSVLAQMMKDEGCQVAVNMDGGQTAVFAFMGKRLNQVSTDVPNGRPSVEALAFGHSDQVGTVAFQ